MQKASQTSFPFANTTVYHSSSHSSEFFVEKYLISIPEEKGENFI
jgi:hypothetical protein